MHDRAALENIYTKEFINVHSSGFIDDRETTINEIVTTDSIRALPIASLDNMVVYGDVAVLKTLGGTGSACRADRNRSAKKMNKKFP